MITYFICYIVVLVYFLGLGLFLWHKAHGQEPNAGSGRGVRKAVAIYLFAWTVQVLLYLPPMLLDGYNNSATYYYHICFLLCITLSTPTTFWVMYALVQHDGHIRRWLPSLLLPGLALVVTYICTAEKGVVYAGYALVACAMVLLLSFHITDYRDYIRRLKTEYSDLSGRDVRWCWYVYCTFALQTCLYLVMEANFSIALEYIYMAFSVVNATILTISVLRIPPINETAIQEAEEEWEEVESAISDDMAAVIRNKLLTRCEQPQLYLRQGLTREVLCREVGVNRTYLTAYLRREGKTYYQYINTLRIRYAMQLHAENPSLTMTEVAMQSGFKTLPTFRKAWQEVQNKN